MTIEGGQRWIPGAILTQRATMLSVIADPQSGRKWSGPSS